MNDKEIARKYLITSLTIKNLKVICYAFSLVRSCKRMWNLSL